MPDALEVETFAQLIEEQYRIGLVWSDGITLGELYAFVIAP